MFGLNDSGTQSVNSDNNQNAGLASPMAQPNPFADTASPAPGPLPAPPADSMPVAAPVPSPFPSPVPAADVPVPSQPDNLLDLKEQALSSLQPLVSHLDQTPEEKFKTTMMLIQATDNSALVKDAYQAANQIPDEKARAQALLDVVNEINYFTQHNGEAPDLSQPV